MGGAQVHWANKLHTCAGPQVFELRLRGADLGCGSLSGLGRASRGIPALTLYGVLQTVHPSLTHSLGRPFAWFRAALLVPFCLVCLACSGGGNPGEPVSWPELVEFDEVAYLADGQARIGDFVAVLEARATLQEVGLVLTPGTIPPNVADRKQVEMILSDLISLIDGVEGATEEELATLVLGMHPVIVELMKAAGMPHVHANEGPNGGFRFPVFDVDGEQVGTAEFKLHDDAGDLEVWLTKGGHGGDPWRLPVETTLELSFVDRDQVATLAVRDDERNEDESGAVTVVDGTTNYFVFPGASGADASWLMGADFAAKAELRVAEASTSSFVLRPHVH